MKAFVAIQVFNFFGVTYVTKQEGLLIFSSRQSHFNLCKLLLCILVLKLIDVSEDEKAGMDFDPRSLSQFYQALIKAVTFIPPTLNGTILLAQWKSRRNNVGMLNRMAQLRCDLSELCQASTEGFEEFLQSCFKWSLAILALKLSLDVDIFFSFVTLTLPSLLYFFVYSCFEMINIVYAFYVFVVIQYFVFAQKALNSYAKTMKGKSDPVKNIIVENITVKQSEICSMRNSFIRSTSFSVFFLLLDYAAHIVYEVSGQLICALLPIFDLNQISVLLHNCGAEFAVFWNFDGCQITGLNSPLHDVEHLLHPLKS